MRRAVLLLLLVPALLAAQTVSLSAWQDGSLPLNHGWRTQAGDNLAWAQPGTNDSDWTTISLSAPNDFAGWRWYRLRVQIPSQHPPLALLITGGDGTYEVYVNGERLPGPELLSGIAVTNPRPRAVPLPPVSGPMEIALRIHIPTTSMFIADHGALRVDVGTVLATDRAHRADRSSRLNKVVLGVGIHLLLVLAAIAVLMLFWYQRDHREYFWLGLYLLLLGVSSGLFEISRVGFIPFSLNWFVNVPMVFLGTIVEIEFVFRFVGQRVSRSWRFCELLLFVPPVFLLVPAWFGFLSRSSFDVVMLVLVVPIGIGLPVLLLLWYHRGNREAGWLILPSLLTVAAEGMTVGGIVSTYLAWRPGMLLERRIPLGLFALDPFDISDLLFQIAIGVVMFFRFTRVSREQARTAAELQAAREIQQRLVPLELPAVSGCRMQAAYFPAEEVGGDFYQVIEQPGGATLLVLGDVSGKGLKAAMTGSVVLGALRSLAQESRSPMQILSRLNTQLAQSSDGGFVTCLCARIAPDGTLTLANAGHLAPHRNGEEIQIDNGLPFGITPDATYTESTLQLSPNDQLTFLSDGVVEAQSPTGELFGFDRTRDLSTRSAEEIAHAAQQFGQQDDIAVLTLAYSPAEVHHA